MSAFCPICGQPLIERQVCPDCGRIGPPGAPGARRWSTTPGIVGTGECTPAVAPGRFFLPAAGAVIALETATGREAWRFALADGLRAALTASDGLVLVGVEDKAPIPHGSQALLALDGADGHEFWRYPTAGHSLSAPAVGAGTAFVTSTDGHIHAVELRTGQGRWVAVHQGWGLAAPSLCGELVCTGGRDNRLCAYDARSGVLRWTFCGGGWFASRPLFAAGYVVAQCWDHYLYALDPASGAVTWKRHSERGRSYTSPPSAHGGTIYIGDRAQGGGYALLALDAATGAERWRKVTARRVTAPPYVDDNLLVLVADDGDGRALDPVDGAERWRFRLPAAPAASPMRCGNLVFLADRDGTIQALEAFAAAPASPAPAVVSAAGELAHEAPVTLELRFIPGGDGATVIWEADVIGRRQSQFEAPYEQAAKGLVYRAIDALHWGGNPNEGPSFNTGEQARLAELGLWRDQRVAPDAHEQVGRQLYARLVADSAAHEALNIVRNHAVADDLPVALVLRFPPAATELAALPWELLHDERGPLLLSQRQIWSCVRYLDLHQALPPPPPPRRTLRILAILPSAWLANALRDRARDALMAPLEPLVAAGQVFVEELTEATPEALVDRLQSRPAVDIVHFYGHGRYADGHGALLLDRRDGGQVWIEAERLAAILAGARLVMLHACQSARSDAGGILSGVAPSLSAAGVPAIIAMQTTIRAPAAERMIRVLYRNLAAGASLQQAIGRVRQALYVEEDDGISWFVPTLTIRSRGLQPIRLLRSDEGQAADEHRHADRP